MTSSMLFLVTCLQNLIPSVMTKANDLEIIIEFASGKIGASQRMPTEIKLMLLPKEKPESCRDFASIGDTVQVDYTGMLLDGRVFDSSLQEGRSPLKFQLGMGKLIKGWERGIQGMCVGEKRKLIIPPHLAYGNKGIEGVIPHAPGWQWPTSQLWATLTIFSFLLLKQIFLLC